MRRFLVLSAVVCAVASVAVVGSALARGGNDSKSPAEVHSTLPLKKMAAGEPFTTKIKVAQDNGETLALVNVAIKGKKYVFVVDTGAAKTQITEKYAKALKLPKVGKPIDVTGIGCTTKAQPVKISGLSIAGHPLPATVGSSSKLAIGKGTPLAGLLGSDVWSQLGSIEVDYANETLTVG